MSSEEWVKFEEYCVELLDISPTASSGSQWWDKGDGATRDAYDPWPISIDAKTTIGKSFPLRVAELSRWFSDAEERGKRFGIPIRFLKTRFYEKSDYILISLDDYAELVALAREAGKK